MSLCHSRCDLENLQLIKAGNSSSDEECGEKSSNVTAVVVGVLAGVFLILLITLCIGLCYCKKKIQFKRGVKGVRTIETFLLNNAFFASYDSVKCFFSFLFFLGFERVNKREEEKKASDSNSSSRSVFST